MTNNHIKQAINSNLSAVHVSQRHVNQIMSNITEGKKVKKKLSVAFVLMMILILAIVTALATTLLFNYFSGYAQLESIHGEYSNQWPTSAKKQLVELMLDSDVRIDQQKATQLLETKLSETEQDMLADDILGSYFASIEYKDTFNIMQYELGNFDSWNYEEKAVLTSLLSQYGYYNDAWPQYMLPQADDVQEAEAIQIAKNILISNYQDISIILDDGIVYSSFVQSSLEYGDDSIWIIEFLNPGQYTGRYVVWLTRDGQEILHQSPNTIPILSGEDDLTGSTVAIPGIYDISLEQAIGIAKETISEIGEYAAKIDGMEVYAYFVYNERFCQGVEPVWLIFFETEGEVVQKVLLGYDGSYIDTVPANREFSNTLRRAFYEESIFNNDPTGLEFFSMTIEQKAAYSQEWIPKVNDYLTMNPYYANRKSPLYLSTRYTYGLPSSEDISEAKAVEIGKQVIIELGAQAELVDQRRYEALFDITDESNPVWKITFFQANGDKQRFRVVIDSHTGIVKQEFIISQDFSWWEFRY